MPEIILLVGNFPESSNYPMPGDMGKLCACYKGRTIRGLPFNAWVGILPETLSLSIGENPVIDVWVKTDETPRNFPRVPVRDLIGISNVAKEILNGTHIICSK